VPFAGVIGGAIAVLLMAVFVTGVAHGWATRFIPGFPRLGYSALLFAAGLAILAAAQWLSLSALIEALAGLSVFGLIALAFNPSLNADILRLIYARKDSGGAAALE
jgi:hypothetical protein